MNNQVICPVEFTNQIQERNSIYQSNCVEFWKPITNLIVTDIEPNRYWISTYGRAYDTKIGCYMGFSHHAKGYLQLIFQVYNPVRGFYIVNRKVHRVVMLTFCYFPGCEKLEVNHKNGNKEMNDLYNLEWNTGSQNRIHAIHNDLENTIFGVPIVKLTPDDIRGIYMLHAFGYTANQTIDQLGLREKGAHRKLINRIINGQSKMYSKEFNPQYYID